MERIHIIKPSDDGGGCKFGWHPKTLAFFITAALGLSIMSALDCKFLEVDLGFTPKKYNTDSLGFSFWSYAAPDGRCLTYAESKKSGFLSSGGGGDIYTNSFISNDTSWTISRILAVVGSVFGSFALISSWVNVFKHEPCLIDVLAYTTITASMSECSKFGLFLGNDLCNSPDYWHDVESNEFYGSEGCRLDRGAIMSICSISAYIFSMTLAVGFAARPKNDDAAKFETASLPSWMASEPGEPGSSAKAQAPPVVPEDSRTMDRSSVEGYAWSRSAPSTIPSTDCPPENKNGEQEQAHNEDQFDEAPLRSSMSRQHYPPPANKVPRKYDDMSTLTWDPGY